MSRAGLSRAERRVALVAAVIFVHGVRARVLIYIGAAALVSATIWNVGARRRRASALAAQ